MFAHQSSGNGVEILCVESGSRGQVAVDLRDCEVELRKLLYVFVRYAVVPVTRARAVYFVPEPTLWVYAHLSSPRECVQPLCGGCFIFVIRVCVYWPDQQQTQGTAYHPVNHAPLSEVFVFLYFCIFVFCFLFGTEKPEKK